MIRLKLNKNFFVYVICDYGIYGKKDCMKFDFHF